MTKCVYKLSRWVTLYLTQDVETPKPVQRSLYEAAAVLLLPHVAHNAYPTRYTLIYDGGSKPTGIYIISDIMTREGH